MQMRGGLSTFFRSGSCNLVAGGAWPWMEVPEVVSYVMPLVVPFVTPLAYVMPVWST